MVKLAELKQLDETALKGRLVDLRKAQMNLRFQKAQGQLEKSHQFKEARRTIARIKTLLKLNSAK